jgi:hypothetical protein
MINILINDLTVVKRKGAKRMKEQDLETEQPKTHPLPLWSLPP